MVKQWDEIFGHALFYNTIFTALIALELPNKYQIATTTDTQFKLDLAVTAIKNTFFMVILWLLTVYFLMYGTYGKRGLFVGLGIAFIFMTWAYYGIISSLITSAKQYNLKMPKFFPF